MIVKIVAIDSTAISERSLTTKASPVQLALITADGMAVGAVINLETSSKDYSVPLSNLKPVKLVTLPRPYPTFLPYFFESSKSGELNIDHVETLQLSIGPGIPENELESAHAIAVESIRLE